MFFHKTFTAKGVHYNMNSNDASKIHSFPQLVEEKAFNSYLLDLLQDWKTLLKKMIQDGHDDPAHQNLLSQIETAIQETNFHQSENDMDMQDVKDILNEFLTKNNTGKRQRK